jgi:hypothetical protein
MGGFRSLRGVSPITGHRIPLMWPEVRPPPSPGGGRAGKRQQKRASVPDGALVELLDSPRPEAGPVCSTALSNEIRTRAPRSRPRSRPTTSVGRPGGGRNVAGAVEHELDRVGEGPLTERGGGEALLVRSGINAGWGAKTARNPCKSHTGATGLDPGLYTSRDRHSARRMHLAVARLSLPAIGVTIPM